MRRLLQWLLGPEGDTNGPLQSALLRAHEEARERSDRKVAEMKLTREVVARHWAQKVVAFRRLA